MLFKRRSFVVPALVVVAAALVLVVGISATGQGGGAVKLEGAWVARVTSYDGGTYPYIGQWSYVVVPGPSGRSAALHGSIDVAFPANPQMPVDFNSPIIGEVVMTGSDTFEFNTYWYAIKKGIPPAVNQIVHIGRAYGEGRSLSPGKVEFTHNFEIYLPAQDADGDGLPDPGQTPVRTFTVTTIDTRIPSPVR